MKLKTDNSRVLWILITVVFCCLAMPILMVTLLKDQVQLDARPDDLLRDTASHIPDQDSGEYQMNHWLLDTSWLHSGPDWAVITVTTTIRPCDIDTIKGILIWQQDGRDGDVWNNGHSYDTGYWVGKCGPAGYMPIQDMVFIPGSPLITQGECLDDSCQRVKYEVTRIRDDGQFFTREWKPVPSDLVYCLYQLHPLVYSKIDY